MRKPTRTIRIDDEVQRKLKAIAERQGRPSAAPNAVIRHVLFGEPIAERQRTARRLCVACGKLRPAAYVGDTGPVCTRCADTESGMREPERR